MRNLKKISAVVVAGAIMLTTFVPAFAAYTPVNNAKALVLNKLDLYAGTDPNEFKPSLETKLTREQGSVLIAKLFNLDTAASALTDTEVNAILKNFADGNKVKDYARKRFAYLVKNDIMSGSLDTATGKLYINAGNDLLGGQFATLILKQLGYTVDNWKLSIDQLADVEGAKDIDAYASYETGSILRDQAVGLIYGALTADYAAAGLETIIDRIVAANPAIAAEAEKAGLIAPKALAVESVKALNAKQIEVKFNSAMDKDSAEDESFYEIKDKGTSAIALGADSAKLVDANTVIITLDGAAADKLTNATDAKVTVKKDIKTVSGLKLAADYVNSAVIVADGVIPSVSKVEAIGETTLKLTFTEPVYNGANLAIANSNITVKSGNYTYYVQNAVADAAKKTITVTVGTKLIEGPITVTVNAAGVEVAGAIQDYAGYKVFKGESTFTYTKDTTVPAVTVKEARQESVTLAFSKPVKAANLKLFHSIKDVAAYQATNVTTSGYVDEITFNFANKIPSGDVKLFLVNSTVSGEELVDGFGIKVPDQTINTNIVVDVTGPVVSSTKLNTNASYELVFDEAIDATEAIKASNYTFKSVADGKDVTFTIGYNAAVDAKKVTLTVPGNLSDNTQYQVVVKSMKDLAGNSMASEATYTFTVGDHTNPTVSDSYAVNADGKIYVIFSEPMNQTQIADKTNYAVKATTGAVFAALGENDTLTVLSNKSVVIDLNTTVDHPSLKLAGMTDLAGKKLGTDIDFVYTAAVITNINQEQVQVADAYLIAKNKVKLVFNKELSSFDNTEFAIIDHSTGADFTPASIRIQSVESMTKNTDGNTEVILVLDTEVNTDATFTTSDIDVKTVANPANTKSVSGTTLAGAIAETVVDKLAPEVVKYNHDSDSNTADVAKIIASNFSTAPVNGKVAKDVTAKISIYFTEDMKLASMSTLTFSVEGYTVTGVALNANNSIVELTVKANADNTPSTTSVTQAYNITDANSNVFASGSVWTVR